jgi:two-component sensor histidine kinase
VLRQFESYLWRLATTYCTRKIRLQQADNVTQINLAHYATRPIAALSRTYTIDPECIILQTELEDVWVGLDTTTPCGLLLHELLTICFKHAFPEERTGHVRVALQATAEQSLMLLVGDTGCGFSETLDFRATDSPQVCSWSARSPTSCRAPSP